MSRLVHFAVDEGIFEILSKEDKSAQELSDLLGFKTDIAARLLDGLVHLGLLDQCRGRYGLTADGNLLVPGADGGFAAMSELWGQVFDGAWGELAGTVRTGESGFVLRYGAPIFAKLAADPAISRAFDEAMRGLAKLVAREVAQAIAPRRHELVCDVGGGTGLLLSLIVASSPGTKGILFDRPDVVARARLEGEQIEAVGGDFFLRVPNAPVHILSNVLHDWPDDEALRILNNVADAQPTEGSLYLVEMMLGGAAEPLLARSTDLNMLMLTGGRERTEAEFSRLLGNAGYNIVQIQPLAEFTCLIES